MRHMVLTSTQTGLLRLEKYIEKLESIVHI
nr:MAG TPA: hypothetical protein [Caudoviricetes sp.]